MKSHAVTWGNVLRRSAAASVAWYRSPRRRSAPQRSPRAGSRQIPLTPESGPKPPYRYTPTAAFSLTCATPRAPGKARTSTSPGPTSPEARSARTTQTLVAGQSRLESGSVVDLGPLGSVSRLGQSVVSCSCHRSVQGATGPLPRPVPLAPVTGHYPSWAGRTAAHTTCRCGIPSVRVT